MKLEFLFTESGDENVGEKVKSTNGAGTGIGTSGVEGIKKLFE